MASGLRRCRYRLDRAALHSRDANLKRWTAGRPAKPGQLAEKVASTEAGKDVEKSKLMCAAPIGKGRLLPAQLAVSVCAVLGYNTGSRSPVCKQHSTGPCILNDSGHGSRHFRVIKLRVVIAFTPVENVAR